MTEPHEILPPIHLITDADWPPAANGLPAGTTEVGSWTVERELAGSTLSSPHAAGGLSVGEASVTIAQSPGIPLSPWAMTPGRRIRPGTNVELVAKLGGGDRSLGSWAVSPLSGSLTSPDVQVSLIERQYVGKRVENLLPDNWEPAEAAWIIAQMAAQVGYHSVPPPPPTGLIDAWTLVGGLGQTYRSGVISSFTPPTSWDRRTGPIAPVGPFNLAGPWMDDLPDHFIITANCYGTITFQLRSISTVNHEIRINTVANQVATRASNSTWVTATYTPGLDPNWPTRVQIEVQRTGTLGAWTQIRVRARSSHTATWSPWATANQPANYWTPRLDIIAAASSAVGGIQLTSSPMAESWTPSNADIDPLGGIIEAPWLPATLSPWDAIQEVSAAWFGATWLTPWGLLACRDRHYLAGLGFTGRTVSVAESIEDIAWSIDPRDNADRLVVTHNPSDLETMPQTFNAPAYTIWQADNAVELAPGQTIELVVDLAHFALPIMSWIPAYADIDPSALENNNIWSAMPNRDGTGSVPPETALRVTVRQPSIGRCIITLTNQTAQRLWTVDANGEPCLILRAHRQAKQSEAATIERGVSESEARNTIAVDLGRYVQRPQDAAAIADHLWGRIGHTIWRASSIRVALDWGLDIGVRVRLTHPESELSVLALITKISLQGEPGEIAQYLDLVLLPPTWAQFDTAWTGRTWTQFDTHWSGRPWTDFDIDPLSTP